MKNIVKTSLGKKVKVKTFLAISMLYNPTVKCACTSIQYTRVHCCMKFPQILRGKTSSQKSTGIALRI